MISFPLLERKITISDGRVNYNKCIFEFGKKAADAGKLFKKEYQKQCESIEDVSNFALGIGNIIIRKYLEECIEYIVELGVYNISAEKFADKYYFDNFYSYEDCYHKVNDKYMNIILTEEEKDEYRRLRKQSRGRWQGGGFGLSGAIKGAATAGALNMASGALHGLVNMGGKLISNAAASRQKAELFNDASTYNILVNGVVESVYNMVYALTNCILDMGIQEMDIISDNDIEEARILMNNLKKNVVPEEKRIELLIRVIELNPYKEDAYTYLVVNYGDPRNEIEKIADYFGTDVRKEKNKEITKFYNQLDLSTEEKTLDGKVRLIEVAKQLGLPETEVDKVKEINKKLADFDVKARTVDRVIFETREEASLAKTELDSIKKIMSKMKEDDEQDVINAKESILSLKLETKIQDKYLEKINDLLSKLDVQARTYNKVVYDTREDALLYKKEDEEVKAVFKTIDTNNLASIDNGYEKIANMALVTDIRKSYLGKLEKSKQKLLEERAKVLASFEAVISNISVDDEAELNAFIERIKASNISYDVKEFVIGQIEKKISVKKGKN